MCLKVLAVVFLTAVSIQGQGLGTCKKPYVEQRLLADDVRFASPFYVIALPRNSRSEQIDNICYTYFENENENGAFFHVMSITYKNGSNAYHMYSKGDLANRMGLAQATALADSECVFHDHTLKPICNVTVFVLYRCFIQGNCGAIDVGIMPGVDVRVVLAAHPHVSDECRHETELNLKDTSILNGGNYVILPQKRKPQCITKYRNTYSVGHKRAVGSKEVSENDYVNRFGLESADGQRISGTTPTKSTQGSKSSKQPQGHQAQGTWTSQPTQHTWTNQPTQGTWTNQQHLQGTWTQSVPSTNPLVSQTTPNSQSYNPYGQTHSDGHLRMNGHASSYGHPQAGAQPSAGSGYTPAANAWTMNHDQWSLGPSPWAGQTVQPDAEHHYHIWQSQPPLKTTLGKHPNLYYHVHSWESVPPGCTCH